MELVAQYGTSVLVLGLSGMLFFVQLLVADVVGIKKGHIPGTAVTDGHESFLFRSNRAFANSNETVGILILFTLFAILSSANPVWVNNLSIVYFIGRVGHMVFYYANFQLMRSVFFVVSAIGLLGIFITGIMRWL
ncbi:MAPEG family protein [Vibrio parahaemolyticus]|uniref:MAPEG family protein n=1 Tax=Vibrio vulnificus TaxID=672 RepID=A0A6S4Q7I0_VIBVL|nr:MULTISPECIES: MAPEG family protein [Vibrio]EGQ8047273.1 MAPEG family protein [Vibrio parahaemolyticus]EHH2867159.1 MAPEG family protein [Vibrio parahaemolyticus]ELA9315681.1 MAPEG family protein [Vibrio parahaemolyticus]MBM5037086.1 MAPEG family protein [Vibrio parahaemolyticus]MBM5050753.1 MAPEG family protein [Vibrio parahaemolyticus]